MNMKTKAKRHVGLLSTLTLSALIAVPSFAQNGKGLSNTLAAHSAKSGSGAGLGKQVSPLTGELKKPIRKKIVKTGKNKGKKGVVNEENANAISATQKANVDLSGASLQGKSETNITTAQQPKKKLIPISVSAWTALNGPTLTNPGNKKVTDDYIDGITGLYLRNQMSFRYDITPTVSLTPVLDFDYQLTDPDARKLHQREFRWRDSFLRLSKSGIGNYNIGASTILLDGDVRYYAPTSKYSRDNDSAGSFRASVAPSVQFGRSKFSLSTANYVRYWIQPNTLDRNGTALPGLMLYTGPQLNYSFTDRITAWVLYEAYVLFDTKGIPNTTNSVASLTDVEPGVDFRISDRVSVSPYLNWFPNQRLSTTTMNIQATVNLY